MTHQNIEQNFVGIWLDNQSKDSIYAQDHLRTIVNPFRTFNHLNPCLHFILNINNANIILITRDTLAQQILPVIHSSEQMHSIYILDSNKATTQNQWAKDYHKIKGFYCDMEEICQKIKEDINQSKTDPTGISFLSSSDIQSRDVNRQDPSFMYSQLLKEIILNDHDEETEEETKRDMLTFCRTIYIDNQDTLNIVDEFEENFLPELSIYWYTRECFLYKMLNTALWTPQPDVLYKLRYFLRHLHQQILSQATSQNDDRSSIIVYRGQNMSLEEMKKLKGNAGGFVSFNNFLSTSLERNVARNFLWGSENGVLFEMYIDPTIEKFPFAYIEHLSFQQGPNCESELLFPMGTVFRIVGFDKQKNLNRVQLMLSGDIDEQLDQYTKLTRKESRSSHSFLSLLRLMHELSLYNSVDRFAEMLDDGCLVIPNSDLLDAIHNIFGLMYLHRGQLKEALEHFHKSLTICLDTLSADHPKLAVTYNNIGSVYSSQSDYETALTFQQLALDCESNSENPNILSVIAYTNNIALIYRHQDKLNDALVYHKRALELQKEHLGENDPSLSDTYHAISAICYQLDDYEQTTSYNEKALALQEDAFRSDPTTSANCSIRTGDFSLEQEQYQDALTHFNRALQIQQQYFLPNNPSLALTYNRIALTYYQQDQFEPSLSNHIKALKIEQNSLSNNHSSIAKSYLDISKDYVGLLGWSDALEYGLKAIEQIKKSPKTDLTTVAPYNHYLGHIYHQQHQYDKALIYYKEALEQSLTDLPDDDASLIVIYYRIANTYEQLEIYNEALSFYQKTLNLELKTLPENAPTIATTYGKIATVYFNLKQFDNAFNAAEQALNQLLKTLPHNHPDVVEQRAALDMVKMIQIINDDDD